MVPRVRPIVVPDSARLRIAVSPLGRKQRQSLEHALVQALPPVLLPQGEGEGEGVGWGVKMRERLG